LKLEKKLNIGPEIATELMKIIEKDAYFFYQRNLMDYSLIIFKINKEFYFENFYEA